MSEDTKKLDPDFYPTPYPLVGAGLNIAMDRFARGGGGWMSLGTNVKSMKVLDPGCGPEARFARHAASLHFGECVGVELQSRGDFDPEMKVHLGKDDEPPFPPRVYFETDFVGKNGDLFLDNDSRSEWYRPEYYDLIIGNPPFSIAEDFLRVSAELVAPWGVICFLLRLAFWTSTKRRELLEELKPAVTRPLIERASFYSDDGIGRTDGTEYAFFVWDGRKAREVLKGSGVKPTIDFYSWR